VIAVTKLSIASDPAWLTGFSLGRNPAPLVDHGRDEIERAVERLGWVIAE
jgi:hypothetical protein